MKKISSQVKKIEKRHKMRVLIVESEKEIKDVLLPILGEEGCLCELVSNGQEALTKLKELPFNLAFIDSNLPDMNGIDLLEQIKQKDNDIISIIITDPGVADIPVAAFNAGAYDYLTRPLETTRLRVTIKRGIEQQHLVIHNKILVNNLEEKNLSLNRSVKRLSHLNKTLQTIYIGITATLAEVLDAKDPQTRGHSERVAQYAGILAEEMKLSKKQIKAIKQASHLHDIGKIGVRDQILGKSSRLDEDEWNEIQLHPQRGKDLLAPLTFLMNDVIPLIWYHHERYDGNGYPDGLKGEDIPLGARIILVADTFDAMTCDRPYRKAKTVAEALHELQWGKKTQFDPKIVDAFLEAMDKGKFDKILLIRERTLAHRA